MQLFILAILFGALYTAPLKTHFMFKELYELERTQIVLDNAAILIGRADRELFRYLVHANKILQAMEKQHHYWHRCARVPKTAAVCKPNDLLFEARILNFSLEIRNTAMMLWHKSLQNGLALLVKENIKLKYVVRPPLPIHFLPCLACVLPTMLSLDWALIRQPTELVSKRPSLSVRVRLLGSSLQKNDWDYILEDVRCENST